MASDSAVEMPSVSPPRNCLGSAIAEMLSASELRDVDAKVKQLIDGAVSDAKAAPVPGAEDLLTDVYVSYP